MQVFTQNIILYPPLMENISTVPVCVYCDNLMKKHKMKNTSATYSSMRNIHRLLVGNRKR